MSEQQQMTLVLLSIVRLVVPLSILRFPLLGLCLSVLCDVYDWLILGLNYSNKQAYNQYQRWDKSMDLYMYGLVFAHSLSWKDKIARTISIITFSLRALGDIVLLLAGTQWILVLTPNVIETFSFIYLFYRWIAKQEILYRTWARATVLILAVTIPKMIYEYLLHVLRHQPWEYFSIGSFVGASATLHCYLDSIFWTLFFHALQIGITIYFILKDSSRKAKASL